MIAWRGKGCQERNADLSDAPHSPNGTILYVDLAITGSRDVSSCAILHHPGRAKQSPGLRLCALSSWPLAVDPLLPAIVYPDGGICPP